MAVPGRRNGLMDQDDMDDDNALFDEHGFIEDFDDQPDPPPHIRAITTAVHGGDQQALCVALDSFNGSIDEPIEDGDTALHLACLYGSLSCVQLLLERGASLESKDEDGAIPLHDACAGGYIDIAQLLISSAMPEGVNRMLETVDTEGDTPLHHAARGGHDDVIRLLLASGASPIKENLFGKTPIDLSDQDTEARRILEAGRGVAA